MRILAPVSLQRAQIIGITEFAPQLLEEAPVTLRVVGTDLAFKVTLEIGRDSIVVEQCIIHVEQENDLGWNRIIYATLFLR